MSLEKIYKEITEERLRQDIKWGVQNHNPVEWCAILGEEVGEVNKEALEAHFNLKSHKTINVQNMCDYRKELIQVAAVAIAMIECLDRN